MHILGMWNFHIFKVLDLLGDSRVSQLHILIDVSLTFSMITPFYLIPGKESLSDAIGMERKLVKQKQKPYFEINLRTSRLFNLRAPLLFPGRLAARILRTS
jgi:hypothetical protein